MTGTEVAPATENDVKFIACSVSSSSKRNNYQPTLAEGEDAERILAKVQDIHRQDSRNGRQPRKRVGRGVSNLHLATAAPM